MEAIKEASWVDKMEVEYGSKTEVKFDIKLEAIIGAIIGSK